MPSLILLKSPAGASPGESIPLDGDMLVIGRDADACQIVIPHHAVSRRHAQITYVQGQYFIEDLRSRNNTFVNNKMVNTRTALHPEDRIKICDFLFRLHDERSNGKKVKPPELPEELRPEAAEEEDPGGMTTIEATGNRVNAEHFLDMQAPDKLRKLLDISTLFSRTLELQQLLNQVADQLFGVFRQADRCFVILQDEGNRLIPKVAKARRAGMDEARFSKTIVKKAIYENQSYLSEDASSDTSLGPAASIAEFKIRSVMCVPLSTGDAAPLGAIQLDTQDRAKKFSLEDLNMLTIVANMATGAVERAKMHETMLTQQKAQKEIELARTVQLGFLPQTLPIVSGYEFYSHYSPAQTVGGDYYDFISLPHGRLAIVLGDVAGKGVPAALLVAKLSSEVRACLLTQTDPAKAIGVLNDQMIRGGLGDRFVTLVVAILDPLAHTLTVVNAGHMSPRVFCAAQNSLYDAVDDPATGLPLGVMPGFEYDSVVISLNHHDTVTIYTDGVCDAMAPDGSMFTIEAVDKYLVPDDATNPESASPKRAGERLVQAVRRHANGRPQNDDIAVVCFGRLGPDHDGPLLQTGHNPLIRPKS